jgi:tetratricopeptide (TPR) repeat protein
MLTVSPDGKRLALVSDQGLEGRTPRRLRVFVMPIEGGKPEPVSPEAAVVGPVCWTPDGKGLVYARSQDHAPPEGWALPSQGLFRNLDLYQLHLETKRETRLSRGGGFSAPHVTRDGSLHFLTWALDSQAIHLRLRKMSLADALTLAAEMPDPPPRSAAAWTGLAGDVLKEATLRPEEDGSRVAHEALTRLAATFERHYLERFKTAAPSDVAGLERQRDELRALPLRAETQARLAFILGVVEGEYLRRRHGSRWQLVPGPLFPVEAPDVATNPFAYVVSPFHPPTPKVTQPPAAPATIRNGTLGELLRRAEGRPIVLSNRPAEAVASVAAVPELAQADALFKAMKADEAARLLLGLMKGPPHEKNLHLALVVAGMLYEQGRTTELLELMSQQRDLPPNDARKFNMLGIALLTAPQMEGEPDRARQAIDAFQNAIRCDLRFGPAYFNLAQAYVRAQERGAARLCLFRYLQLEPQGPFVADAQRRLAELIDKDGR